MKRRRSYQPSYKLFSVLLLISLLLSGLSSEGISIARAQEGISETPAPISQPHTDLGSTSQQSNSDAIVNITAEKNYFSENEDVLIQVTLTNPSNYPLKILRWLTPLEGVTEPLFVVTRDGEKSNYYGPLVSHLPPVENYYITLQAGESITREVNLSSIYDFSVSGNYAILYEVSSSELYFGQLDNAGSLTSNILELYVEGRDFQFKGQITSLNVAPQDVNGSTSYSFCDTSQQLQLSGARNDASTYANLAWNYMLGGSTGLRYTTWFGAYTSSRYNTVYSNVSSIRSAVDAAPITFNCSSILPCTGDTIAYVYSLLPYTIYTCSGYWTLPATGNDSKADTIIHEISHFDIVAGTDDDDGNYGTAWAIDRAINRPDDAIDTADNYAYFSVNSANRECQSMGVPSVVSPVANQTINDNTPFIDWTEVTNNDGYQFQLYNSDFSTKIVDSFAPSFYNAPALSDGTYYWRAMAYTASAGCVDGEWSTFSGFNIDTVNPSVTVTIPNGGESWQAGTSHDITWSAADNVGVSYVALDYSTNGGSTWTSIDSNDPNDGTFSWIVPNNPGSSTRVRVTAYDAAGNSGVDISNANFTITSPSDTTQPTVTVSIPNGGESWQAGTSHNITWSASDNVGVSYVALDYSTNSGSTWTSIDSNDPNDGTFSWTVPNNPGSSTRVRVTAYDASGNSGFDISNANFTITSPSDTTNPSVTVTIPNGAESWQAGTSHDITWSASDNVGVAYVALDYSVNSGSTWTSIDSNDPNDGSFSWTVPNDPSSSARVRVIAYDAVGNAGFDISNANFTIAPIAVPSGIHINEMDLNGHVSVELYNPTAQTANLSGWYLLIENSAHTDGQLYMIPNSVSIASGAYLVVHTEAGSNTSTDLYTGVNLDWSPVYAGGWAAIATPTAGIDFVRWGDSTDTPPTATNWTGINPLSGFDLGRSASSTDTDDGSDWCSQTPTLGGQNGGCNAPPSAFNKSSPANSTSPLQPLNLALSWGSTSPLTKFEYCIDTTNDNACSNWTDNGTGASVIPPNLQYSTTYYWHVRAYNGSAGPTYSNGSATAFWTFKTENSPQMPQKISAGGWHTCAVTANGSISCWGWNSDGQLNVPSPNGGFREVSAGYSHSCGLKNDGSIVCWGRNSFGEVNVPTPNTNFIQVSAGSGNSCGVKNDSSIVCWGDSRYGLTSVPSPNSGFVKVSAADLYNCGLKTDGSITCWGLRSPIPSPNNGFTQFSAYEALCGVRGDGSIACAGDNTYGQTNIPSPNSGFAEVSSGLAHTCALKSDSSIACWGAVGSFNYGQTIVPSPNNNFVYVSSGNEHTCGLKNDSSIVCWGHNGFGQANVPLILSGKPYVVSITRASTSPTNATSVNFTVTFNESVTGVDTALPFGDFNLSTGGVTGTSITGVSGSGSTYTVTVNTGSGNGTIRLDLVDDDSIRDADNNPLGGVGAGNGSYTNGQVYTITKTDGADTTGVFRPSNGLLYLKNRNTTGFADIAINYGIGGDYPVVGDWDGNGTATIGVYRNGKFYLRNSNTVGFADLIFAFGTPGDQPIAGDWNQDEVDTIGVYRPWTGQFMLRNSNTAGAAEMSFYLGNVGDVGIAGDWDGDGIDTTGVFRPSNGIIFLKNTNQTGYADVALNYGIPGDKPVTGDWNNDGVDTIGVYRNGQFLLRNSNTVGFADIAFGLGNPGDMPIAGNWDGTP